MTDEISRRRHMKKVLDRWENEGGSLPTNRKDPHEKSSNERSVRSDGPPAEGDSGSVRRVRSKPRHLP
jgi:hypothetical protein